MKTDHWLIVLALVVLAALGGASWQQTRLREQEAAVALAQARADEATATAYWLRMARWRPWHSPLPELWVSSGVGYRLDPMGGGTEALHKGDDLAAPEGTPVRAAASGVVAEHYLTPGWHHGKLYHGDPVYGAKIVIDHGGGLFSIYGHLSRTDVYEGQWVEAGQMIGAVGHTGIATGDHLHWEVVVDPLRWMEGEQ